MKMVTPARASVSGTRAMCQAQHRTPQGMFPSVELEEGQLLFLREAGHQEGSHKEHDLST